MEMNNRSTNIEGMQHDLLQQQDGLNLQRYLSTFMGKVYGWMFAGLLLTGLTGWWVVGSPGMVNLLFGNKLVFFGLIILEIFLVGYLSVRIQKLSVQTARLVFLGYSFLNGLTLSLFFIAFTPGSVLTVFGITAATFGVMSAVGYFTHQDLTKFGGIMIMGVIGILIASLVNLFLQNPTMYLSLIHI